MTNATLNSVVESAARNDELRIGSAPLQISLHGSHETERWLHEWRQLEEQIGEVRIACSSEWTQTWLNHYGDLIPHRFAIGTIDNDLQAICLLTEGVGQKDGPFPLRTLHLGTAGEPEADTVWVEYNDVLARRKIRREFMTRLHEMLQSESQWDELRFDGFQRTDIEDVLPIDVEFSTKTQPAYFFDLKNVRETSDDIMSAHSKSTRKTIRKSEKRCGNTSYEWAASLDQAHSSFEDLIRLHQKRWNDVGKPGAYASERFTRFHHELLNRLFPIGKMGLSRLSNENGVLGCTQSLIEHNRVCRYQSGLVAANGQESPGVLLDYLEIQECLRRGFDACDYMGGDSYHKQRMSTDSNTIVWLRQRRPTLKQKVMQPMRSLKSLFHSVRKDTGD